MSEQPPTPGGWQSPAGRPEPVAGPGAGHEQGAGPAPGERPPLPPHLASPVNPLLPSSSLPPPGGEGSRGRPPVPVAPSSWGAAPSAPGTAYGLSYGAPPSGAWVPPAKPGVVPLRPLGLGELLDGAVQTLRQNPRVMIGFSAAVMAVVGVVSTVLQIVGSPRLLGVFATPDAELGADELTSLAGGLVGTYLVPAVLQSLATTVLTGVLIVAVSEAVLGRRPGVAQVWTTARPRLLRLVGLALLTGLVGLLVVTVVIGPGLGLLAVSTTAGAIGLLIGVPLALVAVVLVYVRLAFAAPALLLEQLGVGQALQRSWRLVAGSWWRVFGILALTAIIAAVAAGLLRAPFAIVGAVVGAVAAPDDPTSDAAVTVPLIITTVASNLGTVVAASISAPFSAAVTALLYIDLRIRREGLDVALARAAGA